MEGLCMPSEGQVRIVCEEESVFRHSPLEISVAPPEIPQPKPWGRTANSSIEPTSNERMKQRKDMEEAVFLAARRLLHTDKLSGRFVDELSDSCVESLVDVHAVLGNQPALLDSHALDSDALRGLQMEHASLVASLGTPTALGSSSATAVSGQAQLVQEQFHLSSIFDPLNPQDSALFQALASEGSDGAEGDEDLAMRTQIAGPGGVGADISTDNSRTSYIHGVSMQCESLAEDDGLDRIDYELDVALKSWSPFQIGCGAFEEAKTRLTGTGIHARGIKDEVWAIEDNRDMSDFYSVVRDPAIEYPFELDQFQKRAIYRLECRKNVFVAAHTSAGKTVVAEYAIALALQHRTKVIYTSPIKTLSNQKFRDFSDRFGDVGIITGDVSVNPDATILIMTTEILRSLLYRGADMIRDLEFVIFDEIHWLRDPERGVVWEESIIMLPKDCGIAMLSATVPNAVEFASWVGRTRRREVYVVTTSTRPVPLVHSLYVKDETFPLFDTSKRHFLSSGYRSATAKHAASQKNTTARFGGGRQHAWVSMIKHLRRHNLDPAIVFCFSKKKCEEAADSLNATDLTNGATEKNQIHQFFQTSIARLSPADQRVPQISKCRDILKRGLGVHHAGILPIVKEVTEVLFQRGLVRVLFCTETFAVGVNAPARCVVFSAIRKWDGSSTRAVEPGEYTQMAGRAGRRGKDKVGTVLIYPVAADFPTEVELKKLMTGAQKHMKSQFRLTYNMILNLMRVDELRIEDVMSRSFSEAPAERDSVKWKSLVDAAENQLSVLGHQANILDPYRDVYSLRSQLIHLNVELAPALMAAKNACGKSSRIFAAGRLLLLTPKTRIGFALAVVTRSATAKAAKLGLRRAGGRAMTGPVSSNSGAPKLCKVAVLHGGPATRTIRSPCISDATASTESRTARDAARDQTFSVEGVVLEVVEISADDVCGVLNQKIDVNEEGMNPVRGAPNRSVMSGLAAELIRVVRSDEFWTNPASVSPVDDLGIAEPALVSMWHDRHLLACELYEALVKGGIFGTDVEASRAMVALGREEALRGKLDKLRAASSDESLQLMPDCRQRLQVLNTLHYVSGSDLLLKGRAMCEVNSCDLVLVELACENVLQSLCSESLAALLSALVFEEKSSGVEVDMTVTNALKGVAEDLYKGATETNRILTCIACIQAESGLPVSPVDYVKGQVNYGLCEAVYLWAGGQPFTSVCEVVPDVAEGTIVRAIVRLSELLRETKSVARIIGDSSLFESAESAINLIKRDVIFAASLYVS